MKKQIKEEDLPEYSVNSYRECFERGRKQALEEVEKIINKKIENTQKRIDRGIAYDFDRMQVIWKNDIANLEELKSKIKQEMEK